MSSTASSPFSTTNANAVQASQTISSTSKHHPWLSIKPDNLLDNSLNKSELSSSEVYYGNARKLYHEAGSEARTGRLEKVECYEVGEGRALVEIKKLWEA